MRGSGSSDGGGMGGTPGLIVLVALCTVPIAITGIAAAGANDRPRYQLRFELPPASTPLALARQAGLVAPQAPVVAEAEPAASDGTNMGEVAKDSGATGGSSLSLTKQLIINGADSGMARVIVTGTSQILVARADLDALPRGANRDGEQPGYLSFDELRDRGLQVRYDPDRDAIEITG